MDNLPNFPGARACYSRAYVLLDAMAKAGHVKIIRARRGSKQHCVVSEDMENLIDALNKGDEERIKGLLFAPEQHASVVQGLRG